MIKYIVSRYEPDAADDCASRSAGVVWSGDMRSAAEAFVSEQWSGHRSRGPVHVIVAHAARVPDGRGGHVLSDSVVNAHGIRPFVVTPVPTPQWRAEAT